MTHLLARKECALSAHVRRPARRSRLRAAPLAVAVAVAAVAALVSPPKAVAGSGARTMPSALIETNSVQAPRGFSDLCARRPEICPSRSSKAEVSRMESVFERMYGAAALQPVKPELTDERWKQLVRVNHAVNATIRPVADSGADLWSITALAGDCEEYVLMKREMLARLGWPRTSLRITVVRDGQGYHAVLVAETTGGEFVLDNMAAEVGRVEDSPYEFVVAQSSRTPGDWVRVSRLR